MRQFGLVNIKCALVSGPKVFRPCGNVKSILPMPFAESVFTYKLLLQDLPGFTIVGCITMCDGKFACADENFLPFLKAVEGMLFVRFPCLRIVGIGQFGAEDLQDIRHVDRKGNG